LYHVFVRRLSERVLAQIQRKELLKPGDRVGVAVSGGIDSVALLRVLLELRGELGIVLSVVHFNHRLRGAESDGDEHFVAGLAREHELEFFPDGDDVAEHASQEGLSVEAAARELRYRFFGRLLGSEGSPGAEAPFQWEAPGRSAASQHLAASIESQNPHPVAHYAIGVGHPRVDKIVTGHTLDDQAETVLLRLIRGTGINGLSGIHPRILVDEDNGELCGEIVRPLLSTRRRELEQYLTDIGQSWREDSTNSDHAFTRNRLRKLVLPVLEKEFNPAVAENLAELAEIALGEEEYWENEVAGWMGTAVHWVEPEWVHQSPALVQISLSGIQPASPTDTELQSKIDSAPWLVANASVSRPWFLSEPVAVQRRVVKAIGEHAGIPLEFKHVEEIVGFAAEEGQGKELVLPVGWKLVRDADELLFVTPDLRKAEQPQDYEYELTVPGKTTLPEVGLTLEAHHIPADRVAEYNPDELLDLDSLPGPLRVRNWRAGDRFWPAHTKSPRKIKELLQEHHVAQPLRAVWPVVVSGEEIVWVRGFPAHKKYCGKMGRPSVLIAERRWLGTEST
jgi:tRNA(Ile)-lysidine synthase